MLLRNQTSDKLNLAELLDTLQMLKEGNFTARLSYQYVGEAGKIAAALNGVLEMLASFRAELMRVTEEVGVTGRLGGQMLVPEAADGGWKEMVDSINRLAGHLTNDLRMLSQCAEANAKGTDARRLSDSCVRGEVRELCAFVNALADRAANAPVLPQAKEIGAQPSDRV
jgi:osomolarity two-component system sensor histidine kinase NIK1